MASAKISYRRVFAIGFVFAFGVSVCNTAVKWVGFMVWLLTDYARYLLDMGELAI